MPAGFVSDENDLHATLAGEPLEVGAVAIDAGLVIDQHEVELVEGDTRMGLGQRVTHDTLHQPSIPPPVGSASLLQRVIGFAEVLLVCRGELYVAPPRTEQPAHEEQDDQDCEHD